MYFNADFEQNLNYFKKQLVKDETFTVKYVGNELHPGLKMAVLVSAAMVSNDITDRDVIFGLANGVFPPTPAGAARGAIFNHSVTVERRADQALIRLCGGDCVVLIGNAPCCLVVDVKGMAQRANEVPETEISLLGPQDGFNENIMANIGILKKRIASPRLKSEFLTLGRQTNCKIAVCYLEGVVRPGQVKAIKRRLNRIDIDAIQDGNTLAELIRDCPRSVFKTVGKTGRPDVLAAKLLEGRIGVLTDGSPVAVTLPYIFVEAFQSPDDYYQSALYANIGRVLRYLGFICSVFLPGLYLAIVNFNPNALPVHWFYTVLASSAGIPIHTVTEMLLLFFAFEILRETGTRMPSGLGLALNIVGAVILGDAAVAGNIVSTPMVIIVAFSGVTGLMANDLKGAVFYLRLCAIFAGSVFGLPGLFLLAVAVLLELGSLKSLHVPYLYTLGEKNGGQDTLLRVSYRGMIFRQKRFSGNERRQKP